MSVCSNFYVLSGAPGSGKSTLVKYLKKQGYICVDEPARQIIAEQQTINGNGLYNKDRKLFIELMISRAISQYNQHKNISTNPVIFDRGITDMIAYAKLFEVDYRAAFNTANLYKYNKKVLFLESWQQIYTTDEDRTMSFDEASSFGEMIKQAYIDIGYNIIIIPNSDIEQRIEFITNYIS